MELKHLYIREKSDNPELLGPTELATPDMIMKLATGADYRLFEADPIEATYLIILVRDFAVEKHHEALLKCCEDSINRIKPDLDKFCAELDKEHLSEAH